VKEELMAVTKYLSEFYTTKALLPVSYGPLVADPRSPLEHQIQVHVLKGNQLYFAEKYTSALGEYLVAWGLIPRLVDRFFPSEFISVSPEVLLKLDLTNELLTASADIHMFRDLAGPLAPLGGPGNPPPELLSIAKQFGSVTNTAERHYARGLTLAGVGQFKAAGTEFRTALELSGQNRQLQLDARAAIAAAGAGSGDYTAAQEQFIAVSEEAARAGLIDHSAAMLHNSGVAQTLKGDAAGAAAVFAKSSSTNPGALNWSLTHSVNPGIAAFQRLAGAQGMEVVLPDRQGSWLQVKVAAPSSPKSSITLLKDHAGLTLDLTANPENAIRTQLLQPRILATSISGSVANFDFRGKIRKPGISNSMTYSYQNSRKSKFATEPEKLII
jgi:tetratricopeptide (TPR) repeat protein